MLSILRAKDAANSHADDAIEGVLSAHGSGDKAVIAFCLPANLQPGDVPFFWPHRSMSTATYTARLSVRPHLHHQPTQKQDRIQRLQLQLCHSLTSSTIAWVTGRSGRAFTPPHRSPPMPLNLARRHPRANIDRIVESKQVNRRWSGATIWAVKVPVRSRGTSISDSPKSPFSSLRPVIRHPRIRGRGVVP